MNTRITHLYASTLVLSLLLALGLPGCERKGDDSMKSQSASTTATPPATNRVDINAAVRQNLGITFAKVESRSVSKTLRIPGRFELLPTAQREYRAAASGTVEMLVQQYQTVEAGTPLFRLDSPQWREMQKELADAEAAVKLAQAGVDSIAPLLAAHESHHTEIQLAVDLWNARVATLEQLQAAGGARGDEVAQAKASLASSRAELAETLEKEAELIARKSETAAQLDAARARLEILFQSAAALTGLKVSALQNPGPVVSDAAAGINPVTLPTWRTLDRIEIRAHGPGVVDSVAVVSGGIIDQHAHVLSTVQPHHVRFRAVGLQSDLPRLMNGQRARVVTAHTAASISSDESDDRVEGTLTLAPTADPERRTLDLFLTPDEARAALNTASTSAPVTAPVWVRAGVSAFLEVVIAGNGHDAGTELAIPLRCVARDGTRAIIFRRDPADPNKAIRMDADLGLDDGRWVVIKSGVAEGNEIVLDGVYQLMVASSGTMTKGGHFHPDGTFHEGDE